jgi:hypothetical protein
MEERALETRWTAEKALHAASALKACRIEHQIISAQARLIAWAPRRRRLSETSPKFEAPCLLTK